MAAKRVRKVTKVTKDSKTAKSTKAAVSAIAKEVKVTRATSASSTSKTMDVRRLRAINWVAGLLLLAQGIAIAVMSDHFNGLRGVFAGYTAQNPSAVAATGHPVPVPALRHLFDLNLWYLVPLFLLVPAIIHLWQATKGRRDYEGALAAERNAPRWLEFALGGGVLALSVALVSGVYELANLLSVLLLTMLMGLVGYRVETYRRRYGRVDRASVLVGAAAGFIVVAVFASYVINAIMYGNGLPTFVYTVLGTLGVVTLLALASAFLHYRRWKRFGDYAFTDWMYIVLSLVVKSAIAWQIFAGTLLKS